MINLGVEVVYVDKACKLYLFDLNDLLLFTSFLFLLVTVKTELAVVHDLAHGRLSLSGHKHQIESSVVCSVQSL